MLAAIFAYRASPATVWRVTIPGPRPASGISRAPVIVVGSFFAIAVTLVLIGAQLSQTPAPRIAIDTPGTADMPRPINVIMRDYRFDPTPVILVPGETVRITVFNAGMVAHELSLGDAAVQRAWAEADAAATPPVPFATPPPASVPPGTGGLRIALASGQRLVVDYTVPVDEAIGLLCNLPGHLEQGMVGVVELRVLADPASSPRSAPAG